METFENMAQRYYLEIFPNCAQNGAELNINRDGAVLHNTVRGMFSQNRFNGRLTGKSLDKNPIKQACDRVSGLCEQFADEHGSISTVPIKGNSCNQAAAKKPKFFDWTCTAYMPEMKLSNLNR